MKKRKKTVLWIIISSLCFIFAVLATYQSLFAPEKYRYDIRFDVVYSVIGFIICFSYVIWEGYNLGKRMRARWEDTDKQ